MDVGLFLSQEKVIPKPGHEEPALFMLQLQGKVKKGNRFIRKQFQRLMQFKNKSNSEGYWSLCFHLITESKVFFLVSLYKWDPIFYKEFSLKKLGRIMKDFKDSSSVSKSWKFKQIWIESPFPLR